MKKVSAVFILFLSIGPIFSMDWNTCQWNKEEQTNRRMVELIDIAIDNHNIADSSKIETVAKECFNTFGKDYHAAFQAFTYKIPDYERIPEASRKYVNSLSELFDKALISLSTTKLQ